MFDIHFVGFAPVIGETHGSLRGCCSAHAASGKKYLGNLLHSLTRETFLSDAEAFSAIPAEDAEDLLHISERKTFLHVQEPFRASTFSGGRVNTHIEFGACFS